MSLTKLVSLFALCSLTSLSVAACASNTDPQADDNLADSTDEELRKSITACSVDADCVAVPQGGCCDNGWMAAVNKHHTKAYENGTKCKVDPRPMCPMYLVHDTRVPQCNVGKKQCEMVAIEDIACGGRSTNPHSCPSGFECTGKALLVDGTGNCEAVKDCRDTGCGKGKYCSACWGKFACIPNGALC
jgi:hypothetical protein